MHALWTDDRQADYISYPRLDFTVGQKTETNKTANKNTLAVRISVESVGNETAHLSGECVYVYVQCIRGGRLLVI